MEKNNNIIYENENYIVVAGGGIIYIEGNQFEHSYELHNRIHNQLEFRTPSLPEILGVAKMWNDSLTALEQERQATDFPSWDVEPDDRPN